MLHHYICVCVCVCVCVRERERERERDFVDNNNSLVGGPDQLIHIRSILVLNYHRVRHVDQKRKSEQLN